MRLRGRFTLWFAVAALVPIAAAALVTRDVVSRSYRDRSARQIRTTEATLAQEIHRFEELFVNSVDSLVAVDPPHPLIDGLMVELQKSGGAITPAARNQLRESAWHFMDGLGLHVLFIIDGDGVVLAAPHYRPARDDLDPAPERRTDGPFYTHEPIIKDDTIAQILVVESSRRVVRGRYTITVVGGRKVDAGLLGAVRRDDDVDARVVDTTGAALIPPERAWAPERASLLRRALPGPDGAPTAFVDVAIADTELARVLREVTIAAVVLGAAAVVMTILLGVAVARRMTRNLDRLVEGAQAAAAGDLAHRVEVKSRDEIGAVAAAFNAMMGQLLDSKERLVIAERIAAWQEIARRLAHEIKNPLTPIQMAMETLRKTYQKKHPAFDEVFEESTSTVLEESARLKRIVSEFSEFARLPKPQYERCDVNEIVAGALSLYKGAIAVTEDLDDGLPAIEADRGQLTQVVLNLLENARDALSERAADGTDAADGVDGAGGRDGADGSNVSEAADGAGAGGAGADVPDVSTRASGRITVSTRVLPTEGRVELTVADNGPGIPAHIRDRLFTPYFTTKQMKGGTGLGLAIVHRIVSDHGGRIEVGDADAGGARFAIQLPVERGEVLTQGFAPSPIDAKLLTRS